jgi:hypothetical protein
MLTPHNISLPQQNILSLFVGKANAFIYNIYNKNYVNDWSTAVVLHSSGTPQQWYSTAVVLHSSGTPQQWYSTEVVLHRSGRTPVRIPPLTPEACTIKLF